MFFSTCDSVDFHALLLRGTEWPKGLDDANATFSSGGGTGASTAGGGASGAGGKNTKGGKNSTGSKHSIGDNNTSGGNNNIAGGNNLSSGKTFHVEGFEGMEFVGNMDVVADGTFATVTNITSSSSSSSSIESDGLAQVPMRFKERMTNKHMGPSYIDPLPSHFSGKVG